MPVWLRSLAVASVIVGVTGLVAPSARAADCPGNPDALGTARTMQVSVTDHPRIGLIQYKTTLPLADREIVLTFDDGPLPAQTNRILDALKAECVKATFFIIGRMARAYPDTLRRTAAEGHTIAAHTLSHPILDRVNHGRAVREIDTGFQTIEAALGDAGQVAPWFRFPGLGRTNALEKYLAETGRNAWSAEVVGDDWLKISGDEVLRRTLERIEQRGRGVVLLHDIHARTAEMVPPFLRELKRRGYRIVHVVPSSMGPAAVRTTEPVTTGAIAPTPAARPAGLPMSIDPSVVRSAGSLTQERTSPWSIFRTGPVDQHLRGVVD
jgi:peptidoglycan/xylan/chitin deacetylase (PgdA/CDA1 family)